MTTTILITIGVYIIILLLTYKWQDAEERADQQQFNTAMVQAQLQTAQQTIQSQDHQLDAAYSEISRLRKFNRRLVTEKPMTFKRLPMHHAAHLHTSDRGRQLWLTFDN